MSILWSWEGTLVFHSVGRGIDDYSNYLITVHRADTGAIFLVGIIISVC
jgi:hypothetical protein